MDGRRFLERRPIRTDCSNTTLTPSDGRGNARQVESGQTRQNSVRVKGRLPAATVRGV